MSGHVRYVRPFATDEATGTVAAVYRQLDRDLGTVPEPFTLHSPVPELLAGVWIAFRETLIAGRVPRGTKEAIAAAVSDLNRCPWCVDAHSAMLYATGNASAVAAIRDRDGAPELAPGMKAIVEWAQATRSPGSKVVREPPFSPDAAAECIGTAVTFHYLTRMVTALLSETFLPSNRLLKAALLRVGGRMFAGSARRTYAPGESLALLPEAPLPDEFGWTSSNDVVSQAFARFAAVVEENGAQVLTPAARTRVDEHVDAWDGGDPPLGRDWIDAAVGNHPESDRPAARLALLCALAPHRIDAGAVDAFRAVYPHDDALVAVLAWGGFASARRIGTWLHVPR